VIVIVEERETVKDGYTAWFDREGVSATGLCSSDFDSWVKTVSGPSRHSFWVTASSGTACRS
jgi:hypothetical protein